MQSLTPCSSMQGAGQPASREIAKLKCEYKTKCADYKA